MNVKELIHELKKYPMDKPVKIESYYSMTVTDTAEEINSIEYMKKIDPDTFEEIGEITDYLAIVTDKYHEIALEF